MQMDMNKLVYPKCGLALPYLDLGPIRTMGMLPPSGGAAFPRHTPLSPLGGEGPSPPGLVGYNPVLHHSSPPNYSNLNRGSETGYFKRKHQSDDDEQMDKRRRGMSKMDRRNNDRKIGLKVQSTVEDNKCERTNETERHNTCKSPRKNAQDRQNREHICKTEIDLTPAGSNLSMMDRKETGGIKEIDRRKRRTRTEVRAATDIRTGVVMGPYPGPFLLGADVEEDDIEGNKEAEQTIWVCTVFFVLGYKFHLLRVA